MDPLTHHRRSKAIAMLAIVVALLTITAAIGFDQAVASMPLVEDPSGRSAADSDWPIPEYSHSQELHAAGAQTALLIWVVAAASSITAMICGARMWSLHPRGTPTVLYCVATLLAGLGTMAIWSLSNQHSYVLSGPMHRIILNSWGGVPNENLQLALSIILLSSAAGVAIVAERRRRVGGIRL